MTRPARILHLIDSLSPGGAERMAIEIANATDPREFQVGICVTRTFTELACKLRPDVDLLILGRTHTLEWGKLKKLADYCQTRQVDILHIHGRSSLMLAACLAALAPALRRPQMVFHDHYGDVEIRPGFPRRLQWVLRLTQPYYVGVHSQLSQAARAAGLPAERVRTIRNAIDFRPYAWNGSERRTTDPRPPHGVMVANVRPSKDILTLLRALGRLRELDWEVDVVGSLANTDYRQACFALCRELHIEARVHFVGEQPGVEDWILPADFGVLSSRTESGPLALLEYAAAGLPFVSTRTGLISETLAQLQVGEFVDPGDPQQLADGLRRLLALSPAERLARGKAIRGAAAEIFDIQRVIPEWYAVYEAAWSSRA